MSRDRYLDPLVLDTIVEESSMLRNGCARKYGLTLLGTCVLAKQLLEMATFFRSSHHSIHLFCTNHTSCISK
jgi:hypothetical protein